MKHTYIGTDLESMSFAKNYHRWILEQFRPYLGKRLVEVGAGTGNFSELLATLEPDALTLVEPSMMARKLRTRFSNPLFHKVQIFDSLFREVSEDIRSCRPDSIIYVNVLEHIEDDRSELDAVCTTLRPGGRIFVFVPAHQWLYGEFDRSVGHYRRYKRNDLEEKCTSAGFRILHSIYFDLIGIVPWWIKFRLIKSNHLTPGSVRIYDRHFIPIIRYVETILAPPIGKNILLIAEKC